MVDDKKKLEVLIGDDSFADDDFLLKECLWPDLVKRLKGYAVSLKTVVSPEEVIREGRTGKYDVVVSDRHYTEHERGEGFYVLETLSHLEPRPVLILCTFTSEEKLSDIQAQGRGIDYIAGWKPGHKFQQLIDLLAEIYGAKATSENAGQD